MEEQKRLFGTDGVRGIANIYPMTAELALSLGRAIAYLYKGERGRHRIVVGKDTRLSGYMLENALTAGICSMGMDVFLVGPLPTPAIAFITQSMRADAGVVISASHNPFQDNGIKFFDARGHKLDDKIEVALEKLIFMNGIDSLRPTAAEIGKARRIDDASGRYIVYLKETFPSELKLDGLKIVLDCANGAAYWLAPIVLDELGAEVIPINVKPNGMNINDNAGCLKPELLAEQVRLHGAHIGIALDGDADRAVFADEKGHVLDGDAILALCAAKLKREGSLTGDAIVASELSSVALDRALGPLGIKVIRSRVGDRYVVEAMRQHQSNFGGEKSGHIIFLDHSTTGDGLVAGLQVLAAMLTTGKPLSELAAIFQAAPQTFRNVRVKNKKDFTEVAAIDQLVSKIKGDLGGEGRLLLRYSGTEPLARIMIEGPHLDQIQRMADELASTIEQNLT